MLCVINYREHLFILTLHKEGFKMLTIILNDRQYTLDSDSTRFYDITDINPRVGDYHNATLITCPKLENELFEILGG